MHMSYVYLDGREISNAVDTRRFVAEIHLSNTTASSPNNASTKLILAAKRTHRRDPFNGLKYYDGGWNFSDSHYLYVSQLSPVCFSLLLKLFVFFSTHIKHFLIRRWCFPGSNKCFCSNLHLIVRGLMWMKWLFCLDHDVSVI